VRPVPEVYGVPLSPGHPQWPAVRAGMASAHTDVTRHGGRPVALVLAPRCLGVAHAGASGGTRAGGDRAMRRVRVRPCSPLWWAGRILAGAATVGFLWFATVVFLEIGTVLGGGHP